MTSPLSGSLARTIHGAMKNLFLDAALIRDVIPDSPAYDPADPPAPVPVEYACKAVVEAYSAYYRTNGIVQANDRKVLVLAQSLAVTPVPGDRITVSAVPFTVIAVGTDPATAVWELQGRM